MTDETIYKNSEKEMDDLYKLKPWKKDPHIFKYCKISILTVIKMLNHSRLGGSNEVMGLL